MSLSSSITPYQSYSCSPDASTDPPTIFTQCPRWRSNRAVNLGQGFPDTDGPPAVIERAVARSRAATTSTRPAPACPSCARRSPTTSAAATGSSRPCHRGRRHHRCTEAIAGALLGLVNPGDEVIVLEPYYDSYVAMIQMAGGVRRPVTLRAPDFRLDVAALEAAVDPRTRFVLVNTPHNPTGTVLSRAELRASPTSRSSTTWS